MQRERRSVRSTTIRSLTGLGRNNRGEILKRERERDRGIMERNCFKILLRNV